MFREVLSCYELGLLSLHDRSLLMQNSGRIHSVGLESLNERAKRFKRSKTSSANVQLLVALTLCVCVFLFVRTG